MKLLEIPVVVTSLMGLGFLMGLEASPARADFTFGEPVNALSTFPSFGITHESIACFSADGLEAYLQSNRAGGRGGFDLWVYKRASVEDDWGPPENLGPNINSANYEGWSSLTADGLELYFVRRDEGYGNEDLYVITRTTRDSPWGPPTDLGPNVNGSSKDSESAVSSDGLELYFASNRPGGYGASDLYVSKRATRNDPWSPAVNLGSAVNSPSDEGSPYLSPDGLLLVFYDYLTPRPGGYGSNDLWMTRRASRSAPWEPVVNLGPTINGPTPELKPCFTPDGSALYFSRGVASLLKAPILPIVDFNHDGIVNIDDLVILIENWGQTSLQCDIGPMPWGDGKVDAQDLEVLMSHWGEEPGLIAKWKLDEVSGTTAADSTGTNDGTLISGPLWQPDGGIEGGAILLDGVDDYIRTPFVLDPASGPFSVRAWIKNGLPGQVFLSQAGGVNWLMLTPSGALATDLKQPGRQGKPLLSTAMIKDDVWHQIGFVWDGSNRILYVDGVEVARDQQANLAGSAGGLHIGAGATLAPGNFWSGLIDEVRIYNRAVQP